MPSRTPPDTLPATVYLLAWDADKRRFGRGQNLGYLVRGAVLAELSLRGCAYDDEGKVKPSGSKRTGDRVLDDVLREMSDDRPRSWGAWVQRRSRATLAAVGDQLAAAGVATVEQQRMLGIFPGRRVTITDPALAESARATLRRILMGSTAPSDRDAALVALVAAGDLRTALSRRDRKQYAERVTACTELGGPAAPALRKVMRGVKAARASAQAGGG